LVCTSDIVRFSFGLKKTKRNLREKSQWIPTIPNFIKQQIVLEMKHMDGETDTASRLYIHVMHFVERMPKKLNEMWNGKFFLMAHTI
jgi:hypothetical protein